MKTKLDNHLSNIRNFFNLIRTQHPTREEICNFFLECKSFVFEQYGLNEEDYNIHIHFVQPKDLDFDEAKMCADENDPTIFDITLSFNKLSNKYSSLSSKNTSKALMQTRKEQTISKKELLEKRQTAILTLTISFFHELGHVFQYILSPKTMQTEDENKDALLETFEQVCCLMPNNRKTRLIIKTLGKHINALAYMSSAERNADKKAYIYFASILSELIKVEEDEELLDFLCSIYSYINKAKKHNHKIYRAYSKENREAIDKLHELDFENELEKLTRSLEKSLS